MQTASWLRREIEERLEGGGGTLISPAPDFNIDGETVHFNGLQNLVQVQWLLSVITLVSLVFTFGMKIKTTNFDIITHL